MHRIKLTGDDVDWVLSVASHRLELLGEWAEEYPDDEAMREELQCAASVVGKMEDLERDQGSRLYHATLTADEAAWVQAWFTRRQEEIDADLEEPVSDRERHCLAVERAYVCCVLNAFHRDSVEVSDG